jgi:hypothetical protein
MKAGIAVIALAVCARAAAQDEEARIEQLIQRPPPIATAAAKPGRRPAKGDPVAAWIGQPIRVETSDHGLYLGTLHAASPDSLVLDIALPDRSVRYTLPYAAVAHVEPQEGAQ